MFNEVKCIFGLGEVFPIFSDGSVHLLFDFLGGPFEDELKNSAPQFLLGVLWEEGLDFLVIDSTFLFAFLLGNSHEVLNKGQMLHGGRLDCFSLLLFDDILGLGDGFALLLLVHLYNNTNLYQQSPKTIYLFRTKLDSHNNSNKLDGLFITFMRFTVLEKEYHYL